MHKTNIDVIEILVNSSNILFIVVTTFELILKFEKVKITRIDDHPP